MQRQMEDEKNAVIDRLLNVGKGKKDDDVTMEDISKRATIEEPFIRVVKRKDGSFVSFPEEAGIPAAIYQQTSR